LRTLHPSLLGWRAVRCWPPLRGGPSKAPHEAGMPTTLRRPSASCAVREAAGTDGCRPTALGVAIQSLSDWRSALLLAKPAASESSPVCDVAHRRRASSVTVCSQAWSRCDRHGTKERPPAAPAAESVGPGSDAHSWDGLSAAPVAKRRKQTEAPEAHILSVRDLRQQQVN
jgi:hypothetical protein